MKEITAKRLKYLEMAEFKLNALEDGGVYNWELYDKSLKEYNAIIELEKEREQLITELEYVFWECAYEHPKRGVGITFSDDIYDKAMMILDDSGVIFK